MSNTKTVKKKKSVTGEQLIERITRYQEQLADDPKVSETKFHHMQLALYGCKMIIRDEFGLPQKMEMAMSK